MEQNKRGFNNRVKRVIKKSILGIISWLSLLLYRAAAGLNPGQVADAQAIAKEGLFKGWLNNRMAILIMLVECRKLRDPKRVLRINFFLEDLRHHYMPSNIEDSVQEAFDYLREFFNDYPAVTDQQCQKALEMVNRVYNALGYESKVKVSKKAKNETAKTATSLSVLNGIAVA